jgi:hypothetical protein
MVRCFMVFSRKPYMHFPHACSMPCQSHRYLFDHSNYIWRRVKVVKLLHSTLFSNTLSRCSSFTVRDQVSQPYKTTDKRTILCILIVTSHLCICLYFVSSVHLRGVVLNLAQMQHHASSFPFTSTFVKIRIFHFRVRICDKSVECKDFRSSHRWL